MNSIISYLTENLLVALPLGVLAVLAAFYALRAFLWKAFSFEDRVQTILEQKRSSEVRLGKISETLAPFLENFPVDVHKPGTSTVFLGQPIDFIHFDPEEGITFIEIKSGDSRLTSTQRKIRELVSEGKINWAECKVK